MSKEKRKNLIILITFSVICFIGFVLIAVLLACGQKFFIDEFNYVIANHRNAFFNTFFKIITYLGSFYVLALLSILIILIFKRKHVGIIALISLVICSLVALIIKYIVKRPRPGFMLVEVSGYSFPSAHAVMTLALFTVLTYYLLKYLKNRTLKVLLTILNVFIILLIGFSRIYLGVHYVSDVLAGYLISFVFTVITITISEYVLIQFKNKKNKSIT